MLRAYCVLDAVAEVFSLLTEFHSHNRPDVGNPSLVLVMQGSGLREMGKHVQLRAARKRQTQKASPGPPGAESHILSVTQARHGGSMAYVTGPECKGGGALLVRCGHNLVRQ